jgi:hypothetical protein
MKRVLILISALYLLSSAANAQLWKLRRYEISGGIGTTQFFGDIGGYPNSKNILGLKDFTFRHTRINANASLRYRIGETVSARLGLMYGIFHSTDARGSNIKRGFEEKTTFFEPTLTGEFYFIKNKGENSFVFLKGNNSILKSLFQSLDFYFFAGVGGLIYNVEPNARLAALRLKTSGFTEVIPLGIGTSMIFSSKINFGVELGGRFTFSDYLDGYTNAESLKNDVYHILNFTLTYKINTGKNGLPMFR